MTIIMYIKINLLGVKQCFEFVGAFKIVHQIIIVVVVYLLCEW